MTLDAGKFSNPESKSPTGRLTSTEPNMQNIPLNTELGKAIRDKLKPNNKQHVGCGWPGCEKVNFGPVPVLFLYESTDRLVNFEVRIRMHEKTQGHKERRLVWREAP